MKKLFFFRPSASSAGNDISPPSKDKECNWEKRVDTLEKSRSKKESLEDNNIGDTPALRRSLSFSSASVNNEVALQNLEDGSESICRGNRAQLRKSGRRSACDRVRSTQRQPQSKHSIGVETSYKLRNDYSSSFMPPNDFSDNSSHSSSYVLDRYIDGEQAFEKSGSSNELPPKAHHMAPVSPPNIKKQKFKSQSFRENAGTQLHLSSWELMENGVGHESPRKLARKVVERLSQSQLLSEKIPKEFDVHTPITIEDIYKRNGSRHSNACSDGISQNQYSINGLNDTTSEYHDESVPSLQEMNFFSSANCSTEEPLYAAEDSDFELYKNFKEADERARMLSEDLEELNFFQCGELNVPALMQKIRDLTEEKLKMAIEVSDALKDQITERASSKEEIRSLQDNLDVQTRRLEMEKNELQSSLEKELDRRSSEWSIKLEKYQTEEHRLRERIRELAEQNVSLQREVSSLSDKDEENRSRISHLEKQLDDLTRKLEEKSDKNMILEKNVHEFEEKYKVAHEEQCCIRRNYEDKVKECKDLHRSITRLQRTCSEQERTIDGLQVFYEEVSKKNKMGDFDIELSKLRMEQMRLVGVECNLRKEVESYRIEVDSLRLENIHLLERLNGGKAEDGLSAFKLDQELQNRVCCLETQGLSLLQESTTLCGKLLECIKANAGNILKDGHGCLDGGLDGQFIIESDIQILKFRRGVENLARSLQTVMAVFHDKSEPQLPCLESKICQSNDKNPENIMRSELKAETLLTCLLRDKLYTKEIDIEQLQAELAASVRLNDMLKCELQNSRDGLSCLTHKMKDLELERIKKDGNIDQLQNDLQECMEKLTVLKEYLPKVTQERDSLWEEVKHYSEKNMLMNSEMNAIKKKMETLDEDILLKEGQITILKDTLGKRFDLLSSPGSTKDFLLD